MFWFVLKSAFHGDRGGSSENLFTGWDGIGLEGIYSSFVCLLKICLKEK